MAIERNPFDQKGDAEIIELDTSNGASIDIENNVSFDLDPDGGVVVNFEEGIEVEAKPDIKEWIDFKMTDDSWKEWRKENRV